MSNKSITKFIYIVVIISSIVLGELINNNFLYIAKTLFWIESSISILCFFTPVSRMAEDWESKSDLRIVITIFFTIACAFFIAYKGWFVLLGFYIPSQILITIYITLVNKTVKQKESTND